MTEKADVDDSGKFFGSGVIIGFSEFSVLLTALMLPG